MKRVFSWIANLFSSRGTSRRPIRAGYDAARRTDENARYYQYARGLSANALNSAATRKTLRARTRYEVANNSYARGILDTLANDTVGRGPRVQVQSQDSNIARQVEREFGRWSRSVDLAGVLRTMRVTRAESGEAFLVLGTNPKSANPVKLSCSLVEADQIGFPEGQPAEPNAVDGIKYDEFGNPASYTKLERHPGDTGFSPLAPRSSELPAEWVIHWYKRDRPGQGRGIPELVPCLTLFGDMRRYTQASVTAAEVAADIAGVLQTDAPGDEDDEDDLDNEPFQTIDVERGTLLTVPNQYQLAQLKAEQPTTTYGEFKRELLNEIARCLQIPFNIAALNSSGYNYASGRLDHQTYFKSIRIVQFDLEVIVLERIFAAWLQEAVLAGVLPSLLRDREVPHQWFWDGHEHVDPVKEANAQATRLANHTTTLAEEYARAGKDWEAELRQRAKEAALMEELGLNFSPETPTAENEEDDEQASSSRADAG